MGTVHAAILAAAAALAWTLRIARRTVAPLPSRAPTPATPVRGVALAGGRGRLAHRRALGGGKAAAAIIVATALVASGCLSATPPKTPNQREAERHAPRIVVPPPVGEATPRPAPPS